MKPQELIKEYLPQIKIMQLATSVDNQPWVCTVHFYSDANLNAYWCSEEERRHSRELAKNPKVTGYILIHENTPDEDYVIGLSFEGTAELVGDSIDDKTALAYANKLNKGSNFLSDLRSGKKTSKFYKLTPTKFVLFDNKNFPDNSRQEWTTT